MYIGGEGTTIMGGCQEKHSKGGYGCHADLDQCLLH